MAQWPGLSRLRPDGALGHVLPQGGPGVPRPLPDRGAVRGHVPHEAVGGHRFRVGLGRGPKPGLPGQGRGRGVVDAPAGAPLGPDPVQGLEDGVGPLPGAGGEEGEEKEEAHAP